RRALAKESDRYPVPIRDLSREAGAGGEDRAAAEDRAGDGFQLARHDMLGAALAATSTRLPQHHLGEQLLRPNPFCQVVAVIAMGAEHRVFGSELGHYRGTRRLLPDVRVVDPEYLFRAHLAHL